MKKLFFFFVTGILFASTVSAQAKENALEKNKEFTGAKATLKHYHAIYQLDENNPAIINKTIRNIKNALDDPRLAGKIKIELIAYAGGTAVNLKANNYGDQLKELIERGVIVAQCHNSLVEQKISPDQVYDFVAIVPSGNGELILRQAEGWAIVKP
ncbi:MAG: DsrE family protein [Ginsengibacter sp.]